MRPLHSPPHSLNNNSFILRQLSGSRFDHGLQPWLRTCTLTAHRITCDGKLPISGTGSSVHITHIFKPIPHASTGHTSDRNSPPSRTCRETYGAQLRMHMAPRRVFVGCLGVSAGAGCGCGDRAVRIILISKTPGVGAAVPLPAPRARGLYVRDSVLFWSHSPLWRRTRSTIGIGHCEVATVRWNQCPLISYSLEVGAG